MVSIAGAEFQQELLFAFGGGDRAITIAVLDGPVDRTHDCFVGAWLTPLETAAAMHGGDDDRATAQGTHLASLIFGQPCSSVEGIAPLCRGLIAPIFREGRLVCPQIDLADSINRALAYGAQVIQISGGLFERPRQPCRQLIDAIARCNACNVLIVVGAGRHGCAGLLRRCGAANLLPVGALDGIGQILGGGDDNLHELGVTAPGSNLPGATLEGRVVPRSGPNFAAALIAGVAGLLLSVQRRAGQAPDPAAVTEAIRVTSTPRMSPVETECQAAWIGRKSLEAAAAYLTGRYESSYATSLFGQWYRAKATRPDHAAFRPRA
jgi:subtilisin family serine protease